MDNNYMKLLPTPPTDNLYKYMAITGTWIMTGVLIVFMMIIYFDIRSELHSRNFIRKARIEKNIREFNSAILSGSLGQVKLAKEDMPYLESRVSGLIKELDEVDKNIKSDIITSDVLYLTEMYYKLFCSIFLVFFVFGFFLTIIGYRNWYVKHQKKQDRLIDIELIRKENEMINDSNMKTTINKCKNKEEGCNNRIKTLIVLLWVVASSFFLWAISIIHTNTFNLSSFVSFTAMILGGGISYSFLTDIIRAPCDNNNYSEWHDASLPLVKSGFVIVIIDVVVYIEKYLLPFGGVITLIFIIAGSIVFVRESIKANDIIRKINNTN